MSVTSTTFPVPAAAHTAPAVLADAARAAADWIRRRRAMRTQRRILHSLSEHLLRDIGISQSEIEAIISRRSKGLYRL